MGPAAGQWQQPQPNGAAPGWGAPPPGAPPAPAQQYQGPGGPAAPGSVGGSALFDDAALPEWLRNAADQSAGGAPAYMPNGARPGASGGFPQPQAPQSMFMPNGWSAQPPTAQMPPGQMGGFGGAAPAGREAIAPGSMSAQSLLDASSLPTWLGGAGAAPAPAGSGMPLGGDGLSAQSLVDERALPIWLRQQPATPSIEAPPAGSISQWLAAPVTDEPLPTWLNQVYSSAQVPRMEAEAPVNEPWTASRIPVPAASAPAWVRPAVAQGAMPMGQLADDRALPNWQPAPGGSPSPLPGGPPSPPFGAVGSGPVGGSFGAPGAFSPAGAPGSFGGAGPSPSGGYTPPAPVSSATGWPAGASGMGPSAAGGPPSGPDEPVAAFSASDLIDPDALPTWVQQGGAHEEPTFNSATGWTSKGRSMDAGVPAPMGAPAAPFYAPQANGFAGPSGRETGEANLPPWLQQGGPPPAPAANSGPIGRGGRDPSRGGIPEADLPPWLRGQGGGPGGPGGPGGGTRGQPAAWGGPPATQGYAAPQPGGNTGYGQSWGGPMAGPPPDEGPVQHYADLFADELPGADRHFSYDDDHAPDRAYPDPAGAQDDDGWDDEPRRGKGRRRWFGKR